MPKVMGEWPSGWPLGPVSSLGFRLRKEWWPWESVGDETTMPQALGTGHHSGRVWGHLLTAETLAREVCVWCCDALAFHGLHSTRAALMSCEAFCSSSKHVEVQSQSVSKPIATTNF